MSPLCPPAGQNESGVAVHDDRIYVVGGYSIWTNEPLACIQVSDEAFYMHVYSNLTLGSEFGCSVDSKLLTEFSETATHTTMSRSMGHIRFKAALRNTNSSSSNNMCKSVKNRADTHVPFAGAGPEHRGEGGGFLRADVAIRLQRDSDLLPPGSFLHLPQPADPTSAPSQDRCSLNPHTTPPPPPKEKLYKH